jgi:DNA-directed RNA polymerase subunit alpha
MIANFAQSHPTIKSKILAHSETKYTLTIEPLLPGYGHTLGNALRRVLLSSIPGYAVTRIRINDLTHEYQAIDGIVEDAMDVILNLKLLRAKILTDDDKVVLNLTKNGEGEVTASDFEGNAKVQIVNKDLYICSLDKGAKLNIEVEITRGAGYLPVEDINLGAATNPQDIFVDAVFSPVLNVAFNVEQVRVGDKTNYDKIEIEYETDGSVTGEDVAQYSFNILVELFAKIQSSFDAGLSVTPIQVQTKSVAPDEPLTFSTKPVDDKIDLPPRIKNILEKNGIYTNQELKLRLEEVEAFPGIAEKALTTIKDYLKSIA